LQTVTSIAPPKKTVTLDSGKEIISYDTLILAPGGTPRRLPIEGADLENVFTFRGLEDSKKVDAGTPPAYDDILSADSFCIAAQEGKNLVVIGSSFISMELVQAVSKRKLASINVIGMEEFPFELVLGKEVGKALKKVRYFQLGLSKCGTHIQFVKSVSRVPRRQIPHEIKY
jgi:NADPH-dependent 2,4-dienoyl-CoA reductase/sulfur reductase-like enzyme